MITFLVINGLLLFIAFLLMAAEKFLVSYGECSININGDRKLDVAGGDSLLAYLNAHKLFIPSACGGKATCGFCKVKVLSGAGSILPTEEVYVTKTEKETGVRLACQVKVKANVEIFLPEYLLSAEEFESEVENIVDMTHDIKKITLKVRNGKKISFKAGQYIQFKIPGTDEFRAYSIASSPYMNDKIELIIRQVPGGLCSTYVHKALEPGDNVIFTGSFGDFFLHEDSDNDIIAIGGGCGMAPILSIIQYLMKQGMKRRMSYFFGARTARDLFLTETLREIEKKYPNFKYYPALSEPRPEDKWDGEVGFVTQTAEKYLDEKRKNEAYLCGPAPMIDAAIRVLTKKGILLENIYYDKF